MPDMDITMLLFQTVAVLAMINSVVIGFAIDLIKIDDEAEGKDRGFSMTDKVVSFLILCFIEAVYIVGITWIWSLVSG